MRTGAENDRTNRKRMYSIRVIEDAFIKLMCERPFYKITVTDICKCADVNRSTFYANYIDTFDLAKKIQDRLMTQFYQLAEDHYKMTDFEIYRAHIQILLDLHLEDVIYKLPFNDEIVEEYDTILFEHYAKKYPSCNNFELMRTAYRYSRAGAHRIIHDWISSGKKQSIDEVAEIIANLTHLCIESVASTSSTSTRFFLA